MRRLLVAELRDSWSAWLGVCIAFVVTNFALALSALTALAGYRAVRSGQIDVWDSSSVTFTPASNLVFAAIIGAVVIGTSTSLVVDSRRGSLARLALSGATPGQVVGTIMSQLVVVSVACSLVGDALAYAVVQPTLQLLANERLEKVATPAAVYVAWPVLLANLLAVGIALVGAARQARRASRIPPVEALRQAAGSGEQTMTGFRWVRAALSVVVVIGAFAAIPGITAERTKETISNLFLVGMSLLVITAALLSLVAPVLVGPLTAGWTRLVPSLDPSWDLARRTAIAKAARLTKSVVPVMMTIGLLFGMQALADTMQASIRANGYDVQLDGTGVLTFASLLGLPLLVALAGGVGSLIMMAKQRDAELALSGVIGTTPGQRLAMPVFEGMIIAVTGLLLALVMVVVSLVFLAVGFPAAGFTFAFSPSVPTLVVLFVIVALVTVAATLVPTLRARNQPEPRVIARLVAE